MSPRLINTAMGMAIYLLGGVIGFGLAVSLAPKTTVVEMPYPVPVGQKVPGPAPPPCPPVPTCPPSPVPLPPEAWPPRLPEFEAP